MISAVNRQTHVFLMHIHEWIQDTYIYFYMYDFKTPIPTEPHSSKY